MTNKNTGIVILGGKEYQTVALRVQMFRESHPDWTILTEIVERSDAVVVVKASIINDQGRLIATGHAEEYRTNKGVNSNSALENCETSSIGRCLAAYGLLGGGEFATANEVQNAIADKPKAPNPLQAAADWGLTHIVEIERAGFGEQWQKALSAARIDELRKIKAQVMEAIK